MFKKSQYRDEKGKIDLPKIDRKVEESFDLAKRCGLNSNFSCRLGDFVSSDAKIIAGHFERKYDVEIVEEIHIKRGFFGRESDIQNQSYVVKLSLRNSTKHR